MQRRHFCKSTLAAGVAATLPSSGVFAALNSMTQVVSNIAAVTPGVGALFTAPLGGALFAPEVLYKNPEFEGEAIIPCIVSSIVAYTTFTSLTGRSRAIEIRWRSPSRCRM